MRTISHSLLTWLLIAVMAIPAVSPLALRHSHVGGDASHRHESASAATHKHEHEHSHSTRHSHRDAVARHVHGDEATQVSGSPVEHRHVVWVGFVWTMPTPVSDPSGSRDPIAATVGQWILLSSEVTLPNDCQDAASFVAADLAIPSRLEPRLTVRPILRLDEPPVSLLCDTARRERSGVLVV